MDKISGYRLIIKSVFENYVTERPATNEFSPGYQLIFDDERGHYLLYRTSWKQEFQRIHFCIFHVDIIHDKIWIQEDASDFDLTGVLVERGISKNDIILGFKAPYKRPFTGYAVA